MDSFGNISHGHDHHSHAHSHAMSLHHGHHGQLFSEGHSHSSGGLTVPPDLQLPGEVFRLKSTGVDSIVGLCCNGCKGPSTQIAKQYALPAEASFCISLQEVNEFVDKINIILKDTHMPMIPIGFVPCLLMCIVPCYYSKRQTQLKALVEEMNTKASVRDCHW
jgi:hypothetical protein